jgi:hypothetical protein
MEIDTKERLLKGAAVTIVFLIFALIPIIVSNELRKSGMSLLIREDLGTVRNWGELYRINNGDYRGFGSYFEVTKKVADIKEKGGRMEVFVDPNGDEFCAKAILFTSKGGWCVDSRGYSGTVTDGCHSGGNFRCQ